MKVLGYLSCFATAGLADDDEDVVVNTGLYQLFLVHEDREVFLLLPDAQGAGLEVFSRLWFSYGNCLLKHFIEVPHLVFILLLSDFPPLFGILNGIHGRSVEGAFGILDDSDGGKVDAGFGGLPCEEGRFLLIDLDIGLLYFFHVGLGFFADVAHVVHATVLPRIIIGILSILIFFFDVLYFDAGEGANAVGIVSRVQGVSFWNIWIFLVELSAIVLIYFFHADSDTVGE